MLILGDIGNSVTKLFLVNSKDRILKKISLPSKLITDSILNKKFKFLINDFKKIEKLLFCSVVPKNFNFIKILNFLFRIEFVIDFDGKLIFFKILSLEFTKNNLVTEFPISPKISIFIFILFF